MTTTKKKAKHSRVYEKSGRWYWHVPRTNEWVKLTRVDEGEIAMLRQLAAEKERRARPEGTGNARKYIDDYVTKHKAAHREKAWPAYGKYAGNALRNVNVEDITATVIMRVLKFWEGKLHMQRVMRAFLSGFCRWCIEEGRMMTNPCLELKGWIKKPKPRSTYITDEHFAAIHAAMVTVTYERAGQKVTAEVPSGEMLQCFIETCYVTMQRSTEIRNLQWKEDPDDESSCWVDLKEKVIHFRPSKTEDSSGIAVDLAITPEIDALLERARTIGVVKSRYVFHTQRGKPYAANSILKAFKAAKRRAGLTHLKYTVKDIRAKALTDAKRAGYDIKALQEAAAHTDAKMTMDYLKLRDVPVSRVRLTAPLAR